MNKQCTGCVVSAGTHKPAEALHAISEKCEVERLSEEHYTDEWIAGTRQWREEAIDAMLNQKKRIAELEAICDEQQAGIDRLRAQLAAAQQEVQDATQPAAQGMDAEIQQAVEAERERICAAIKAEDDHCVDQGDYMLDSNDCIEIVRGKWVRPDYSLDAAQAKQGEQP